MQDDLLALGCVLLSDESDWSDKSDRDTVDSQTDVAMTAT